MRLFAMMMVVMCAGVTALRAQGTNQKTATTPTAATAVNTAKFIGATRLKRTLHVQLVGKDVRYTPDDVVDSIGDKLDGEVFAASTAIKVTYPQLNPLRIQATASVSQVDDPTHAAITQLIEAIAGIPSVVAPPAASGVTTKSRQFLVPNACPAYAEANSTLTVLQQSLYNDLSSAEGLKTSFTNWRDAIGKELAKKSPGPAAIRAGVEAIDNTVSLLKTSLDTADKAIKSVESHASAAPSETPERRTLNIFIKTIEGTGDEAAKTKARAQHAMEIQLLQRAADDADDCAAESATLYGLIRLSNPEIRLAELRKLQKSISALRQTLSDSYAGDSSWLNGTDYVLALDVMPYLGKLQHITVKVQTVDVETSEGQLSIARQDAGQASFDVQQYSSFVPEVGIGATFGFVDRPKYGTGKDANGQTIVTRVSPDHVSVDPTVMVNFVPRGMSGAVPFFQMGAATSKTSPAVFIGGGWRVPGTGQTGGIGVGIGLMLAWVKELQKLHEGSVVSGSSDIESDLAFNAEPKRSVYFNIQYKF